MLLTEAEAQERWCPFARTAAPYSDDHQDGIAAVNRGGAPFAQTRCIVSRCMAWRWTRASSDDGAYKGFCGLAGRP